MPKKEKARSAKWATFREIADHFGVSVTTVRLGRGAFASLRRVPLSENRIAVLREDFEQLDRELEQAAVSLDGTSRKRGPRKLKAA